MPSPSVLCVWMRILVLGLACGAKRRALDRAVRHQETIIDLVRCEKKLSEWLDLSFLSFPSP
jgi:hypothetical protein